ncbi:MAG: phosphoribosylformylglycinamidine synthase, partial [Bacteroidetes bacterium]
ETGLPTQNYPDNPNGSLHAIAGICDPKGRILGMMPHFEDAVKFFHEPNWRRNKKEPDGLKFFKNLIAFAKTL